MFQTPLCFHNREQTGGFSHSAAWHPPDEHTHTQSATRVGLHACQSVRQLHLDVGDGRLQSAAPVDQSLGAIDETRVTESDEGLGHCGAERLKTADVLRSFVDLLSASVIETKVSHDRDDCTHWVQGETGSTPVQRGSQFPQLMVDGLLLTVK